MTDVAVEPALDEKSNRLTRGVLRGTLLLCVFFAAIDFLASCIFNLFVRAVFQTSTNTLFFEFLVFLFCGLIFAQWPVLWLWLRRNVRRRIDRLLVGFIVNHLIVGAQMAGNSLTTYTDSKIVSPLSMCVTFYIYFIVFGILLEGWLKIFRIKDLAVHPARIQTWSLLDVFVSSGLAAILAFERGMSSKMEVELGTSNLGFEMISTVVLALASSLMAALSLGVFGSQSKKRFALAFCVVSLLAPIIISLGTTWNMQSGVLQTVMLANVFWWALVLGIFLVFPVLRPLRQA
jgi:hypothetical protein